MKQQYYYLSVTNWQAAMTDAPPLARCIRVALGALVSQDCYEHVRFAPESDRIADVLHFAFGP
jgi:hypothetical protein